MTCKDISAVPMSMCFGFGVQWIKSATALVSIRCLGVQTVTHQSGVSVIMRAATSFSTKKIQSIIDDLGGEVDKVDKLGLIVEGRKARGERQDSEKERQEAGLERIETRMDRKLNAEFRKKVLEEHEVAQQGKSYRHFNWQETHSTRTPLH
jgi:hypothetical protein